MDEAERRKRVIANGRTDLERWADPARLEAMWQARSVLAADLVPAGSRVLELGCGTMTLERSLPFGCSYQPCDVVARDERTIVVDLNTDGVPEAAVAVCDLVVMLGVWEYLFTSRPAARRAAKKISLPVCRRGGGTLPGVDLDDSAALLDRMEGRNRSFRP